MDQKFRKRSHMFYCFEDAAETGRAVGAVCPDALVEVKRLADWSSGYEAIAHVPVDSAPVLSVAPVTFSFEKSQGVAQCKRMLAFVDPSLTVETGPNFSLVVSKVPITKAA